MKRALFCKPGSILIERIEPREGPSPVYNAWKPHKAQAFTDRKALLKFAAWPKSTPTGVELREWLDSFEDVVVEKPEHDAARIKAEGWGPEAHQEEPNDKTRMVT